MIHGNIDVIMSEYRETADIIVKVEKIDVVVFLRCGQDRIKHLIWHDIRPYL